MKLVNLELVNFRNYVEQSAEFDPCVNIITGSNGEGKTNLIESVYLLSMGRSFRTNIDSQMIGFGRASAAVRGDFEIDGDNLRVEVRLEGRHKDISIGASEHRKSADLQGLVYSVLFSPEDLSIANGEPEHRRRFMDRELFQIKPLYYLDVIRYKRIVRNRNLILKEPVLNEDLLEVYDGYLAETGARIMMERVRFAGLLYKAGSDVQNRVVAGGERLEVYYEPGVDNDEIGYLLAQIGEDGGMPAELTTELCRQALLEGVKKSREKDRERGATTVGPHRDDLILMMEGIDLRAYGSRGQQRTAALALKLAELNIISTETGQSAILLLDDVLSELDEGRQKRLIRGFEGHQIILTAACISGDCLAAFPAGKTFEIRRGAMV